MACGRPFAQPAHSALLLAAIITLPCDGARPSAAEEDASANKLRADSVVKHAEVVNEVAPAQQVQHVHAAAGGSRSGRRTSATAMEPSAHRVAALASKGQWLRVAGTAAGAAAAAIGTVGGARARHGGGREDLNHSGTARRARNALHEHSAFSNVSSNVWLEVDTDLHRADGFRSVAASKHSVASRMSNMGQDLHLADEAHTVADLERSNTTAALTVQRAPQARCGKECSCTWLGGCISRHECAGVSFLILAGGISCVIAVPTCCVKKRDVCGELCCPVARQEAEVLDLAPAPTRPAPGAPELSAPLATMPAAAALAAAGQSRPQAGRLVQASSSAAGDAEG